MTDPSISTNTVQVSALSQRKANAFALRFAPEHLKTIATELGLTHLRKLSFSGAIEAVGKTDWKLKAKLGATALQPCVVTLEPVTTRIDAHISRLFLAHMPDIETQAELGEEIEMPDDETIEPLGATFDLETIMIEALALALPTYPRSANADLGTAQFTEPGKAPMRDSDVLPFASLAGLRDSMNSETNDDQKGDITDPPEEAT